VPIHDWTRVAAGIFHHFHLEWIASIGHAVNRMLEGSDYYALAEQVSGEAGPDVLTLQARNGVTPSASSKRSKNPKRRPPSTRTLTAAMPKARFRAIDPPSWYAAKKRAVVIHHVSGDHVVAVLEVISPGNKSSQDALDDFEHKARQFIRAGVHFSFIDLYPPTRRDPEGLHPVIWGDDPGDPFRFDAKRPLTVAAYVGGPYAKAFVTPVAVGEKLPDLPLFLSTTQYISIPLEKTYLEAFAGVPRIVQGQLTGRTHR
jgi:hypothetical protein